MIEIVLNGEAFSIDGDGSISALLKQLDLVPSKIAVEVNESIVSRSEYDQFCLKNNDRVEIIQAVGGG